MFYSLIPVNIDESGVNVVSGSGGEAFKEEAIDDLWSEIRDDDKNIEMPQVEKGQITHTMTTSTMTMDVERNEVGQMTSSTEAKAIPLENKSEVVGEEISRVSTACGPSPDREIQEVLTNEANEKPINVTREIPIGKSSKVSIGTSPPPQNVETQVIFYIRVEKFYQRV